MVIAFTGAYHGQTGTTTNAAALALYWSEEKKRKALLMSLQPGYNHLDRYLGGGGKDSYAEGNDRGMGIEALRKLVKAGMADREGMEGCVVGVSKHLDWLPGNFLSDSRRCLKEYTEALPEMVTHLSKAYEIIFCDAGSGDSAMLGCLKEEVFLTVQNINQNAGLLERCFKEGNAKERDKSIFFLIGCYDPKSKYNIYNLRNRYKALTKTNSAYLPYCTEIRDACSDGKLHAVLGKWRMAGAAGTYLEYCKELKNCVALINRLLERRDGGFRSS